MKATENTESTEKDSLTHAVIGAALEVHRLLGPGLLESIHDEALCHEFRLRGLEFERQKAVDVIYKEIVIKGQRLDLSVERVLNASLCDLGVLCGLTRVHGSTLEGAEDSSSSSSMALR